MQLDHQVGHGATQGGPFQPLELEQALRGAAAGSPTLALPQRPSGGPGPNCPQPQHRAHPVGPGGGSSRASKRPGLRGGVCCLGSSGLTPGTGPTPRSPCKAFGCRTAQPRCSGPGWEPSASSGEGLCSAGPTRPARMLFEASAWSWMQLLAARPMAGRQGQSTGSLGKKTKPLSAGVEVSGPK